MELEFKTKNPKQITAAQYWIDDESEQIVYGGAKGGGKSYLGAVLIFGDALIYPDTHYFIARQELNDLRKFTIPTIHEVFRNWNIDIGDYANFNGQDNSYSLYNGSRVFLIACKEVPSDPLYERFGSMQMTRGWIEEGGEVVEAAKANLWLSIGRWQNDKYSLKKKLLITCNPKKGWIKREFVQPYVEQVLPVDKKYIQAFATDNVYLPKDYIKTLASEKDVIRRQRLWEGNWDYDDDNDSLVTFDALSDSFTNTIAKLPDKYLVVDVARLGKDETVFSFWEGLELYKVVKYQKVATDKTEQLIRDYAAKEQVPYSHILVDEDGVGGGVVDHLVGIKGFVANASPFPTANEVRERQVKKFVADPFNPIPKRNFRNLKAQCAWKLAELINEHKIRFNVPEYREVVIEELTALLRDKDPDNDRIRELKPKDEVKMDLGHSPDLGDTLIQRMYFELFSDATNKDPIKDRRIRERQNEIFMLRRARQSMNTTK